MLINQTETKKDTNQLSIERIKPLTARVGVLGVGHHTYWPQFDGLLDEIRDKQKVFEEKIGQHGVEVISLGMSDCAETAYELIPQIKAANLDLLFIDMLTYATSSSIASVFREIDLPMAMVALQPLEAMDYQHASTYMQLLNDDICAIPEFINVAVRFGRPAPPLIIGTLYNDEAAEREVVEYCQIAKVLHSLKTARIGQMGHVLEAMQVEPEVAANTIRVSLGWNTTRAEVERFCEVWLEMARDA